MYSMRCLSASFLGLNCKQAQEKGREGGKELLCNATDADKSVPLSGSDHASHKKGLKGKEEKRNSSPYIYSLKTKHGALQRLPDEILVIHILHLSYSGSTHWFNLLMIVQVCVK